MLYLYENITIFPRLQEEFWKVMGTDYLPEAEKSGQRLVGMFMVGIHYNENLALWEVDDWSTLDRLQEYHDKDPLAKVWQREAIDHLERLEEVDSAWFVIYEREHSQSFFLVHDESPF